MATEKTESELSTEVSPFLRFAGAFLLAAAMFGVAAVVAFGTYGRNSTPAWAFVVLAGLFLGAWLFGRSQAAKLPSDQYSRQRTMLGVNAVTSALLVLVLLVGVNYIAARRHKTFDLTKSRVNSLAPQTYTAIQKLKSPVRLTFVYVNSMLSPPEPSRQNKLLLDNFTNASDNLKVKYVDAATSPTEFQRLSLTGFEQGSPPQLVVETISDNGTPDPNRQVIKDIDEQSITSALMKIADPKERVVYTLTGHGEPELNVIGGFKSAIELQNYTLKPLSLTARGAKVPADAAAVIAIGPQVDLGPEEAKALTSYFNNKGHLILLLAPQQAPTPRWNSLLKQLGLKVRGGYVADQQQAYQSPLLPQGVLGDKSRHPLLKGVVADTVFPATLPMEKEATPPAGVTVTPLFETSAQAGVLDQNTQQFSPGGPFVLAAAVEKGNSRSVVVASANFVADDSLSRFGNKSFLQAAVNWTAGNDALVTIPPKPPVNNTISMPQATQNFVKLFAWFVLPLAMLSLGTVAWWRRR